MLMKRAYCILGSLFFLILFVCPFFTYAADTSSTNAGFVDNPIWYSKDPFAEGDTVQVYTFLFNPGPGTLSGSVEFYDKNVVLSTKTFTLLKGAAQEIFTTWKVTAGDHSISAKILNPKMTVNGKTEAIVLENNMTGEDKRFIPKTIVEPPKPVVKENTSKDSSSGSAVSSADNYVAEKVSSTPVLRAVDTFRQENAKTFTADRVAAQASVNKTTVSDIESGYIQTMDKAKPAVSPIPSALRRPLDYVSLFFYTLLAFIFSHAVVFYGLIALIIFFILRFFYRLIRR